jgi:pilus assembly protein TadC
VVVTAACWWALRHWSTDRRGETKAAAADLPIAVDLLAAALRAGAPPARAAEVVGEALGGPLGRRLVRVGTALRLGIRPEEAWAPLTPIPGAERVRRAAVRSADSGAAMTGALGRLAGDLRAARTAHAEAAAQRLGVFVVLPLGLCFLPAFLLTGVVPVVVAVLGDVLRSR